MNNTFQNIMIGFPIATASLFTLRQFGNLEEKLLNTERIVYSEVSNNQQIIKNMVKEIHDNNIKIAVISSQLEDIKSKLDQLNKHIK
jgi:hypothetical protein